MTREKSPPTSTVKRRAPRKVTPPATAAATPFSGFVDQDRRMALIAEAAYFRAESRGFVPGQELEDWVSAEAEIDAKLLRETGMVPRV